MNKDLNRALSSFRVCVPLFYIKQGIKGLLSYSLVPKLYNTIWEVLSVCPVAGAESRMLLRYSQSSPTCHHLSYGYEKGGHRKPPLFCSTLLSSIPGRIFSKAPVFKMTDSSHGQKVWEILILSPLPEDSVYMHNALQTLRSPTVKTFLVLHLTQHFQHIY